MAKIHTLLLNIPKTPKITYDHNQVRIVLLQMNIGRQQDDHRSLHKGGHYANN